MALIESGKEFDKEDNHRKLKKRMENMDTNQYSFRIPKKLHQEVKVKLATENRKLQNVLIEMLEAYINKS